MTDGYLGRYWFGLMLMWKLKMYDIAVFWFKSGKFKYFCFLDAVIFWYKEKVCHIEMKLQSKSTLHQMSVGMCVLNSQLYYRSTKCIMIEFIKYANKFIFFFNLQKHCRTRTRSFTVYVAYIIILIFILYSYNG